MSLALISQSDEPVLDPENPLESAHSYVNARYRYNTQLSLRHHGGVFYNYKPEHSYRACEDATLRADLYRYLALARKMGSDTLFKPNTKKINNVLDALKARTHLPSLSPAPCWLDGAEGLPPLDLIPCANGLLHLPTRALYPSSAQFFALSGLAFPFTKTTVPPVEWLRFLHELWPEDADSQETLQEWIGYCLTARTHFQKMLLLVGPKRSGKGTIGRIMRALIGPTHVVAPTLSNLGEQFGLACLIDKSVAIIADARISGRSDLAVLAERLLSISGEDTLSIPRKFMPDWTGRLATRFTIMTNELPRIEDASGALASRFLVLALRESFFGREDHTLYDRLEPELPGILHWALDGLDRLRARGRFIQPESSNALIQEFEDLGSPMTAFLRDCTIDLPGVQIRKDKLYDAWKDWCKTNGREHVGTTSVFGRNLRAVKPFISESRSTLHGQRFEFYEGIGLSTEGYEPG